MKRVLIISNYFLYQSGGAELQAFYLGQILAERYEVHYAHFDDDVKKITFEKNKDHKIWHIPKKSIFRKISSKINLQYYWQLKKVFRIVRPSFCYQRGLSSLTLAGFYLSKLYKVKFIWHCASDLDITGTNHFKPKNLIRTIEFYLGSYGVKHADTILVQTNTQRDLIAYKYKRNDVILIRNMHPISESQHNKNPCLTVVWVANFKPIKQPEKYIDIVKLTDRCDILFYMIGRISDLHYLKLLNSSVPKIPNLTYLGEISNEEVNAILSKAHLLINTSNVEGFSNVFIQAWMRRVLVLSLNVNPDQMLNNEKLGRFFSGDCIKLAEYILELNQNREALATMSAFAEKFANKNFSQDALRTTYLNLFENL